MNITEIMSELVLQLGIIIFAVRLGGRLVKRVGIPSVLGELLAGVAIGPYALGGISLPGFAQGLFPLGEGALAVSSELYAFATVASIILLFASGLETDLGLFLRYSLAGGVIGIGGVVFSFSLGAFTGVFMLHASFMDPRCLFLGVLSTATSVGITARILSDHKRMDSPEGVTILAAAVFDDVLGIIALAVVLGIVALLTGGQGGSLNGAAILGIAGKAFGIWLGFTALGLIFSRKIAGFLKLFKSTFDFSVLALGIALLLAGVFEKQGLAMIIGAYVTGLSLSKTDIAAVIQERIHGLYEFFVPIFFAVMGMMVNLREIASPPVLIFGAIYTLAAVFSKVAGCGGPALLLGFNFRGALRIGAGMVPRGEVALIIAGIGRASGVLDDQLFGVIIIMTLITTLAAAPLLSASLKIPGPGTRKPVKGDDSAVSEWEFFSDEIADLVVDNLLRDLKAEGFYVQMMNIDEGLSQARKDDISLSITEAESMVTIETSGMDMPFVKTAVYEVILRLSDTIQKLKDSSDPGAMKKGLLDPGGRTNDDVLSLIQAECVSLDLKGNTKEEILTEMVEILHSQGKLEDRDQVLEDVSQREKTMSTGMQNGIALPHAKTEGVRDICVAVGIKKQGVDFESMDGLPSRLFIMVVSAKKTTGPHIQFLASVGAVLNNPDVREKIIEAKTREDLVALLHGKLR
ncbi:Na+/H+ antiporter [Treponema primitia ZAS-2]|uniref:Na+/H+ antiporter n=1 Tax=Treponema primitia (strain ATCC BAA-887 / DSM 12427 / ZAS-2) TaxID=545694 RepID=F5YK07_TREPZ|nr:cation:proton antiporter [Treponema primitia]AEF85252.1 Na+/H+ antiporter [Treponema primitia ZAS-2]